MRRLNTHDIFVGMRLVKVAGVKEVLQDVAKNGGKDDFKVGFELIADIIGNCGEPKAEKTMLELLSGPLEISVEDLSKMDFLELIEKIKELGEVVGKEDWISFFDSVLKVMR